ncbi:hypothetical protein CG709_16705, partial [Lachnotalea glycerini]
MNFKEGKCPKCLGILQVPEDRDKIICMYCGEKLKVAELLKQDDNQASVMQELKKPADYDKYLQIGMERLPKLLTEIDNPLVAFKKDRYEQFFNQIYQANSDLLEAIEQVCLFAQDKEETMQQIALNLVNKATLSIDAIPKKGAKEQKLMDYNLSLAVYVIPVILKYKNRTLEILADKILSLKHTTEPTRQAENTKAAPGRKK